MVFILYKIYSSHVKFIGAYENEKDAITDKTNLITDTSIEELGLYKYEIVDIHYFKNTEQKPMKISEEDSNIEEEDYYNLVTKSKHQSDEIIILKEELSILKEKYNNIIKENINECYFIVIGLLALFSGLVLVCLV
jgi:hypothetical protein